MNSEHAHNYYVCVYAHIHVCMCITCTCVAICAYIHVCVRGCILIHIYVLACHVRVHVYVHSLHQSSPFHVEKSELIMTCLVHVQHLIEINKGLDVRALIAE